MGRRTYPQLPVTNEPNMSTEQAMTTDPVTTSPVRAATAPAVPPIKLLGALLKAKQQFTGASKGAKNSHFGNSYATLEDVLEAVEPALHANGLLLVQQLVVEDTRMPTLVTQLWHVESGQSMQTVQVLAPGRADNHSLAGAVTYFRRCQVKTLLCIAETDDDGNEASGVSSRGAVVAKVRKPAAAAAAPVAEQAGAADGYDEMTVVAKIRELQTVRELQTYLQSVVPHLDATAKVSVRAAYDERYAELRG